MPYSLRDYTPDDKLCQHLYPEAFAQIMPLETICEVLSSSQAWEEREQKLNMVSIISLLLAMGLFPRLSIPHVLSKLAQGTRFVWADPGIELAGPNAISYRRQQLGILPLRRLFETVCRARATPETRGAFRFGYHVMALDSTLENVPDTPANDAVFGRTSSNHGQSAFPQVRGTYLLECGTHLLVDAVFAPCRPSEQLSAPFLLPRLKRGMLLLLDRGFHRAKLFWAMRQSEAHVLGRLSASAILHYDRQLADGTYLAWLYPDDDQGHQRGKPMAVRVIEYRLDDPLRNPTGETHRLVTSLLNPRTAPALDLINLYHERWEIELAIDELDTHQRLCQRTLRSLTPQAGDPGTLRPFVGLLRCACPHAGIGFASGAG
jgi:hypothetical protein